MKSSRRLYLIGQMEFDAQGLIKPIRITFDGVERCPLEP